MGVTSQQDSMMKPGLIEMCPVSFFASLAQTRNRWEDRTVSEALLPSDQPVGMSLEHFFELLNDVGGSSPL